MLHVIAAVITKAGNTNPISYTLTGTQVSPTNRGYIALSPATGNVVWNLCGNTTGSNSTEKGQMQNAGYTSGDGITYGNAHAWVTPASGWGTLYVRLTQDSGTTDSSSHAIDGTTWHTFTEDTTNITWTESHNSTPPEECVVKVEIATDSGGTDIVATGYYKSTVSSEA